MAIASPKQLEVTYAEVRSQLLHDGTRSVGLGDLSVRYRAILEASVACQEGEPGAHHALRQALIDMSALSMELVARMPNRPAHREGVDGKKSRSSAYSQVGRR